MRTKDIRNALKERLTTGTFGFGTSISWPNVEHSGVRPYFSTAFSGITRIGDGVEGDQILEETGQFNVVVVVEQGQGEDVAADYADQIAALFPEGLALAITDGSVAIIAPVEIRGGFLTDADYRMPAAIRYHALRT